MGCVLRMIQTKPVCVWNLVVVGANGTVVCPLLCQGAYRSQLLEPWLGETLCGTPLARCS
jgi:hypothetical protein